MHIGISGSTDIQMDIFLILEEGKGQAFDVDSSRRLILITVYTSPLTKPI